MILRLIASFILYIMGWNIPDSLFLEKINEEKRCVCIFPHTSNFDFIIMSLYGLIGEGFIYNSYVIIKPQLFNNFGFILKHLKFLKATPLEESNKGFVKYAVERIKNDKKALVFISPEGKRDKSPWRSGYYYIAKELNCKIYIIGLDYEKKELVISQDYKIIEDRETLQNNLMNFMSKIVPLYPNNSYVNIRKYDPKKVSVISLFR